MKSWQLIKALEEGKNLVRIPNENWPDDKEILKMPSYQHPDEVVRRLEVYGWGSAIGTPMDRIKLILEDSEYRDSWKVENV